MENNKLKYSIVIPNWNGRPLLEKNLPFVIKAAGNAEIIVVDDGSTDDSVTFLKQQYPKIKLIEKITNTGFSSTVNLGVAQATAEIVILLNTDISPTQDFIKPLLNHFTNSEVFAVGCLEKSKEKDGEILRGRGEAAFQRGLYIHRKGEVNNSTTAWVSGGSGAFRKSIWDNLGGLDVLYDPFYWEDIDLSYRALKAGYKLVFEPKSVVIHTHSEGAIKTNNSQEKIIKVAYRNQFIFIWKNINDFSYLLNHLVNLPIILIKSFFMRDFSLIKGFVMALVLIPKILNKRKINRKIFKYTDHKFLKHNFE